MNSAELAQTKELAFLMTERFSMNPISAKLLNEAWAKAFPDEVAIAERMMALVEALEKAQTENGLVRGQLIIAHRTLLNQRAKIAELESRTVTVKLPERYSCDLGYNAPDPNGEMLDRDDVLAMLAAAGIQVTGD